MQAWGIFGGTFDPVHLGHVALAHAAQVQLDLQQVLWMPAGSPWQKQQPVASADHRVAMLQLAIESLPADEAGKHTIDRRELLRSGPSYTVDTLDALEVEHPHVRWHLVIGQDQLARLHTWHRWQDLVDRVTLVVVARDGQAVLPSAEVRAFGATISVLTMPAAPVSSTALRGRLARGASIAGMVPEAVARYIALHRLYQTDQTDPTDHTDRKANTRN
jgi:nicotinate-nucleotide adenylyltransferase